jgi:hypothetical protein
MNAKDAIRTVLKGTQELVQMYVSDLSDADFLVRPVPNANHIAWQVGHLINAECDLVHKAIPGGTDMERPAGFKEQYTKDTAAVDPLKGFTKKAELLALFNRAREATLAALEKMSDADLDRPTEGQMAKFAPTLGAMMLLQSNHTLMHAGQFTVLRRKLGKPILF